jgi:hypothetical protein
MRPRGLPRPTPLLIAGLACLALLGTAVPAVVRAHPDDPCRLSACEVRLKVGEDETKWRSIETFYPFNEQVVVTLKARGRPLTAVETWGPGGCRTAYNGSGIVAVAKACGSQTPLRVRAYRMKRKRTKLVVAYRALPTTRSGDL